MTTPRLQRGDLEELDRLDPLCRLRREFNLPPDIIYLDGNSLGPLPCATAGVLADLVERQWGEGLIRSWNRHGWIDLPERIGGKLARLLGAAPGSIIAADSSSVNLFKLLSAALRLRPGRRVILTERGNFPTDLYIAEGLIALLDAELSLVQCEPEALLEAIDASVAVVMLTHVNYRTGAMHDMARITAAAHAAGALTLWDLAHSAGAVPVALAEAGADLAVGCGYKFLNGGPGAPAFLYVAPGLQEQARFPLTGWFGHAEPFAFEPGFRAAAGIARAAVGTPSILAMAALEVGVDTALSVKMSEVRAKSLRQSRLLMDLAAQECPELVCVTPSDPLRRGSQVSFRHEQAYAIMQALIEDAVIGDFRTPDLLRFGITPLTLRYIDLWDAVACLRRILTGGIWRQERFRTRNRVT